MLTGVGRRLGNLLADTTYQSGVKSTHIGITCVFVSNLNSSMVRCRPQVPCLRTQRGGLACNSRKGESQISKLSRISGPGEGQPNNRKLNEPPRRDVKSLRQIHLNYKYTGYADVGA